MILEHPNQIVISKSYAFIIPYYTQQYTQLIRLLGFI